MAFYYEAEMPTWKYKARYKSFVKFKKRQAKVLEKLYQAMLKGDQTVTTVWRHPENNQDITLNVKTMSGSGQNYYHSHLELSREGYPYPDPTGKNTPAGPLEQMFDKYGDEDDPNSLDEEGAVDFFKELGIDLEDERGQMKLFIFQAMCEASDLFEISRKDFVRVFKKCGCMTFDQIKKQIKLIEDAMYKFGDPKAKKINKAFGRWVFSFSTTEAKAKSVLFYPEKKTEEEVQAAEEEEEGDDIPLVQHVYTAWICTHAKAKSTFPLGEKMFGFLSQREQNSISKDSLVNIAEFMMTYKAVDNISQEELDDWPLIIGDFVEWVKQQK